MIRFSLPLIGCCAYSGTGKTTLLAGLLPRLQSRGLRVAVVKHAHHAFEMDQPGKDSHSLRLAGAHQVLVASRKRMAWVRELKPERSEPSLQDALDALDPRGLDLVLVEGFKHEPYPKIELHRPSLGRPLIYPDDENIIAIVTDAPLDFDQTVDIGDRFLFMLDLNDHEAIAAFIVDTLKLPGGKA